MIRFPIVATVLLLTACTGSTSAGETQVSTTIPAATVPSSATSMRSMTSATATTTQPMTITTSAAERCEEAERAFDAAAEFYLDLGADRIKEQVASGSMKPDEAAEELLRLSSEAEVFIKELDVQILAGIPDEELAWRVRLRRGAIEAWAYSWRMLSSVITQGDEAPVYAPETEDADALSAAAELLWSESHRLFIGIPCTELDP